MTAIRTPLHIPPDDLSPEACRARINLHMTMAALNPNGWRKPRAATKANSRRTGGNRDKRSVEPVNRLTTIAALAQLAGKSALYKAILQMGKRAKAAAS